MRKKNKDFTEINRSVYNNLNCWNNLINRKKIEDEWIEFEHIPNYTIKNPVLISDNDDNGDPLNITLALNYDVYDKTK